MLKLKKQQKTVDDKIKTWYDISIIINKNGVLTVIDNSKSDYHDFISSDTKTVIPMIIKL